MREDLETRLRAFSDAAVEFCGVVDRPAANGPLQLLRRLRRVLPARQQRLLELPKVVWGERDDEIPGRSDEEWAAVYHPLKNAFGKYDVYRTVFDSQNQEEAVQGSLADDLADSYFEVLGPIGAWKQGADPIGVIWELRMLFYSHGG
jgi:Domain of unknown function (DUF5063)